MNTCPECILARTNSTIDCKKHGHHHNFTKALASTLGQPHAKTQRCRKSIQKQQTSEPSLPGQIPSPSKLSDEKNDEDVDEAGEKKKKKRRKNKKKKKKAPKMEGVETMTAPNAITDDTNEKTSQNDDDNNGQDNDSASSAEDLDFEEDLKQFSLRLL